MQVPHVDAAGVSQEKIVDYLLNPKHPEGGGKAAFFAAAGFRVQRWQELANALLRLAKSESVSAHVDSPHGSKYIVDGAIETPSGRTVAVRTVWVVDHGSQAPRLVTAYPHREES